MESVSTSKLTVGLIVTISIRIEPETGMAIATCSGVLQLNDAREGVTALWKTPDWLGRSVVWDFREAEFDASPSDIREIAEFVLRNQPEIPPLRVAWVTPREVDFGMSRMFDVFRQDQRTEFRVFRNYDEAIFWARSVDPDAA